MTQQNFNAYGHDLAEHLTMTIIPAERRHLVAECSCGWRSPLSKKPDAASRLYGQMHLKPLQAAVDAARCRRCFKPWAGDLCPRCQELATIFSDDHGREGGSLPSRPLGTGPDEVPVMVVPGERITDPDRAEALGLTVDAERMRRGPA